MRKDQTAHIETVAVHAGRHRDPVTGAAEPGGYLAWKITHGLTTELLANLEPGCLQVAAPSTSSPT